ncbi:MAG: hypothetical protein QW255_01710 [Candidatus Bilamarchaeaceae archaeon]
MNTITNKKMPQSLAAGLLKDDERILFFIDEKEKKHLKSQWF